MNSTTTSLRISLHVEHPSIDPDVITHELDLIPTRYCRVGSPRTSPKGESIGGVYKNTSWLYSNIVISEEQDCDIERALCSLLDKLENKRRFIVRIRDEGGSVSFFVGWFISKNAVAELTFKIISRVADLKIDVILNVYP